MSEAGINYQLIEDAAGLAEFAKANQGIEWMCFDTEFIGEKRFLTLICLIQIGTTNGYYLIDPLKIKDLQPVIDLLVDERVLKIVHAGDNDYRLFHTHYGILPRNTFDTQMAASFIGYKHPVGFSKLVESELNIEVSKGYTVTDWERRPFQSKQLKYWPKHRAALRQDAPAHPSTQRRHERRRRQNRHQQRAAVSGRVDPGHRWHEGAVGR